MGRTCKLHRKTPGGVMPPNNNLVSLFKKGQMVADKIWLDLNRLRGNLGPDAGTADRYGLERDRVAPLTLLPIENQDGLIDGF